MSLVLRPSHYLSPAQLPGLLALWVGGKDIANNGIPVGSSGVKRGDRGFTIPTQSDYVELLPQLSADRIVSQVTIAITIDRSTVDGNATFGNFYSGGWLDQRCGAHVPFTDGVVYWDFGGVTSGSTRLSVAGLTISNRDSWVFTAGLRGMEIWQNGRLRASNGGTPSRVGGSVWGLGRHDSNAGGASTGLFDHISVQNVQMPAAWCALASIAPSQALYYSADLPVFFGSSVASRRNRLALAMV